MGVMIIINTRQLLHQIHILWSPISIVMILLMFWCSLPLSPLIIVSYSRWWHFETGIRRLLPLTMASGYVIFYFSLPLPLFTAFQHKLVHWVISLCSAWGQERTKEPRWSKVLKSRLPTLLSFLLLWLSQRLSLTRGRSCSTIGSNLSPTLSHLTMEQEGGS